MINPSPPEYRGRGAAWLGRLTKMLQSEAMAASDAHRVIDAVWRIEPARLIAGLARIVRDVGVAEELA